MSEDFALVETLLPLKLNPSRRLPGVTVVEENGHWNQVVLVLHPMFCLFSNCVTLGRALKHSRPQSFHWENENFDNYKPLNIIVKSLS